MARRRSRRSVVKGKPNMVWIASAGDMALISGDTVYDPLLVPGDWSGTVTESGATLLRMVLQCYTIITTDTGYAFAQNAVIFMGDASEQGSASVFDISNPNEWPDFFAQNDRVLHNFRLEWAGSITNPLEFRLPVQFSQLPEPVMNLKTPRLLKGDDSIRLGVGGAFAASGTEVYQVVWFCRSLVRIGLR